MSRNPRSDGSLAAAVLSATMVLGFLVGIAPWPAAWRPVALWVSLVLPVTAYWLHAVRTLRAGVERAEARMAVEALTREAVWVARGDTLLPERRPPIRRERPPRLWVLWLACAPPALAASWLLTFAGWPGLLVLLLGLFVLLRVRQARLQDQGLDAGLAEVGERVVGRAGLKRTAQLE